MKLRSPRGFTLIEMITVIAVLVVLASLVIATAGFVQNKASRTQAEGEIKMLSGACESYKIDTGSVPRDDATDKLDPREDVAPTSGKYQRANLQLYSSIMGDFEPKDSPDGKLDEGAKRYVDLPTKMLSYTKDPSGGIQTVKYIQDPFGYAYGYSTAQNEQEEDYRKDLRKNPTLARPTELKGYNASFDMWSTANSTTITQKGKWVKNWAE